MSRRSRIGQHTDVLAAHRKIDREHVMSILERMNAVMGERQQQLVAMNNTLNTFKAMLAAVVKKHGPLTVTHEEVREASAITAVDCTDDGAGTLTLTAKDRLVNVDEHVQEGVAGDGAVEESAEQAPDAAAEQNENDDETKGHP